MKIARAAWGITNNNITQDHIYYNREQEAKEQDEEREIVLDLEMIEKTRVDEQQTHLLKVPNFLHFDEKPFDRETFEDEEAEEEEEEDLQTRIKLKVENTIRWRFHNNQVGDILLYTLM